VRRVVPLLLALVAACAAKSSRTPPIPDAAPPGPMTAATDVVLYFSTKLQGNVEPCGCTSDPLGDLARTAALIAAEKQPTALFDGGSTLFQINQPSSLDRVQERLKAQLVVATLPKLQLAAAGLGPFDLVEGPAGVIPARQAVNVPSSAKVPLEAPKIVDLGGVPIGVFGVVDPTLVPTLGATDPIPKAKTAIADLRARGARVVIAIAHMPRPAARKLATEAPGADFILVGGAEADLGQWEPEHVGTSTLFVPGERGQVLTRLALHVEPTPGPFVDAIGQERAAVEIARLEEWAVREEASYARWIKEKDADKDFLATRRAAIDEVRAKQKELADRPVRAEGSWFTSSLVSIKKGLPCDKAIVTAKQELDRKVGEANLAAASPPPSAEPGKPSYVGVEECVHCHKDAVDHWRTTRHAGAWPTLTRVGKQTNRYCVSCHVTGWEEPGGSALGTVVKDPLLREVQCEVCHGPASLHVDADGKRTDSLLPVDLDLCATRCHTPEHSDTFQLDAYLRDVLSKGHGAKARAELGSGPSGRELRAAALAKAGSGIGENCPK
jgi:Cytochrome c554 and c-prime